MSTHEMRFVEGEEKLAVAFEQIACLQRMIFVLDRRIEIDGMLLAAMLDSSERLEVLRGSWRKLSSAWLPPQLLRHINEPQYQEATNTMNQRAKFWNDVINQIAEREK